MKKIVICLISLSAVYCFAGSEKEVEGTAVVRARINGVIVDTKTPEGRSSLKQEIIDRSELGQCLAGVSDAISIIRQKNRSHDELEAEIERGKLGGSISVKYKGESHSEYFDFLDKSNNIQVQCLNSINKSLNIIDYLIVQRAQEDRELEKSIKKSKESAKKFDKLFPATKASH